MLHLFLFEIQIQTTLLQTCKCNRNKKELKEMFEVSKNSNGVNERSTERIKTIRTLTFYKECKTSQYHVRRKQECSKLLFLSRTVDF